MDENRKLRSLLVRHGIGEDNVEAFLRDDAMIGGVGWDGGLGGGEAVRILETLLNTKRSCYGDSSIAPVTIAHSGSNRGSSAGSSDTLHWDSERRHSDNANSSKKSRQSTFLAPGSNGSPMSRAHRRTPSLQDQHRTLMAGMNNRHSTSGHTTPDPQLNGLFDFEDQFDMSSAYPPPPQSQQQSQHSRHHSNLFMHDRTNGSGINCNIAAEMITSMSGGGGHPLDVRADLGCMAQQDMDCEVDNQVVFSVMDRYSGQGIGL